jgi:formimidoylglutamate deiminase
MTEQLLFAERALLPDGWSRDVLFEFDAEGGLAAAAPGAQAGTAPRAAGPVIPGMPNLHSHAFQRAMAGLAERAGPGEDSFWSWREVMYRFVRCLRPEQVEAVAAQLYVELLKAGYTAVGEFHYLHHDPEGRPYGDLAEMSRRILSAARRTGMGLTHLPVLYGFGGFGGESAGAGQRRFLNDPERFLRLVEAVRDEVRGDPRFKVGIAPHSLRAVTPETLRAALEGLDALDAGAPVHIHVAEQQQEVRDCIDWSGQRPVEWLLTNLDPGPRWCLVHATHVTEQETEGLAKSGAVAGLCPTTEANLGDGVFPAQDYLASGGTFGIGSDSHVSLSPVEELRWLEYGQRLIHRRRALLRGGEADSSVGSVLYRGALAGGARALGRPIGSLAPGRRADLVVLDGDCPALLGKPDELLLDALVFAGNENPVRDVMVGGGWVVRERHHDEEVEVLARYRSALVELTG